MMKDEFEKLIDGEVPDEEYKIIEHVYVWHPAIREVGGKQQIANLYTGYGMSVIRGMVDVADRSAELSKLKRDAIRKLDLINMREEYLRSGDTSLEKMIETVNSEFMKAETPEAVDEVTARLEKEHGADIVELAIEIAEI